MCGKIAIFKIYKMVEGHHSGNWKKSSNGIAEIQYDA